ncbi:RNA polymerase sigma factor RpoD/SigA [Candidatus Woesearchaeota archaeon]|nr:RNA polymerase sigma factor RpoD/SigA [Candidatus Woesearchaeota archaeon]
MKLQIYENDLGSYLKSIKNSTPLTPEREAYLSQRIREGGDLGARNELVGANLRFVISVAKSYQYCGLSLSELISEGNYGLFEAAKRFDERRGFKFITYAVWWVRQAILKALFDQSDVRKPMSLMNDIRKVEREISRFEQNCGRFPSLDEIAERTGISYSRTFNVVNDKKDVSLDAPPRGYGEDSSLYEKLEDCKSISPESELQTSEQDEEINYLLDCLDDREKEVVMRYYGLSGYNPMTLEQIGAVFKLTRERIRQLKERAQGKMLVAAKEREISLQDILVEG